MFFIFYFESVKNSFKLIYNCSWHTIKMIFLAWILTRRRKKLFFSNKFSRLVILNSFCSVVCFFFSLFFYRQIYIIGKGSAMLIFFFHMLFVDFFVCFCYIFHLFMSYRMGKMFFLFFSLIFLLCTSTGTYRFSGYQRFCRTFN